MRRWSLCVALAMPLAFAACGPDASKQDSGTLVGAVAANAVTIAHWLEIRVDDDGPGLTPEQLADPIIRGRRLDETKPGSGLGHSIVADLAHSYSGKLELARSELGGLSAKLTLPRAT